MSAVLEAITKHADVQPHAVAISGTGGSLSYADLADGIERTASILDALTDGCRPAAIWLDNGPAWIALDLAAIKLGVPTIPVPPFFSKTQIDHVLRDAGASFLISDRALGGRTAEQSFRLFGSQVHVYRLQNEAVSLPDGTAKITYTSGTTGLPKGVCLSQQGIEQVALSVRDSVGDDYAGIHLAVLPLSVLLENVAGLYATLLAGGQYCALPQNRLGLAKPFAPDFQRLAYAVAGNRATSLILVPELLDGLLRIAERDASAFETLNLVAVGGAKVSASLLEKAEQLGLPVYQGYGLSEAGSVVALNTPQNNAAGTVGRVLPHIDLTLSEDGEILIRAPGFLGYVGQRFEGGVFQTGDIGQLDSDGRLIIAGRKSNVIVNAYGRNIAPEWVESELVSQPEIGQALVFGEARPTLGALIVPGSAAVTDDDLARAIALANAQLPDYAAIRHWTKVGPFTVANGQATPMGKPRRAVLLETYRRAIEHCYERSGQTLSFFDRLVRETAKERQVLYSVEQIRDGVQGHISLETYIAYLTEAYHHVKYTVPLMQTAIARLSSRQRWMAEAFEEYIEEERGHEEWILNDIRNAGGNAEAVRHGEPLAATAAMVDFAYGYVNYVNPAGLLGMVFVLEGTSTALATRGAEAVKHSLGLKDNCFSYLTSHGALDIEHIAYFQGLVAKIEDAEDQEAIIEMAKRVFLLFADVFASIPHHSEVQHVA